MKLLYLDNNNNTNNEFTRPTYIKYLTRLHMAWCRYSNCVELLRTSSRLKL